MKIGEYKQLKGSQRKDLSTIEVLSLINDNLDSLTIQNGAALTKTDDTNVTLTLGGSPTTALLATTSLTLGWTGTLALSRGGTAKALTAVNGGVVWTDADSMEVSAAGTSGQVFQSNGAAAPTFVTALANGITATTQSQGDNSTKVATTAYVDALSLTGVVREVWIPAAAMTPRVTNGAAVGTTETTTNDVTYDTYDFDQTTSEGVCFNLSFPQAWNASTVKAKFFWTASAGTGTVTWTLKGGSIADDDAIDTAYGTGQSVTDTLLATGDMHITSATSAITIAGSPAVDDWIYFEVTRDISDTLSGDAKLIGVKLQYTETSTEPVSW